MIISDSVFINNVILTKKILAMKKLSITLLGFILSAYALADSSGTCGYNLMWSYKEATKTLTIFGSGDMNDYTGDYGNSPIPWKNYRSDIETVEIGNDVTSIGNFAFLNCANLKQIKLPNKITYIGERAFKGCESLTSISIPASVSRIGMEALTGTGWFNSITDYGPVYLDNWLIGYNGLKPYGDFSIASGTKGIADCACYGCATLESVYIPDGVAYIGGEAFRGCSSMTTVVIGNSVSKIYYRYASSTSSTKYGAFDNCKKLSTILYSGDVPPEDWVATTNTYVPNKNAYTGPTFINGADATSIKEMMSFENEFAYSGVAPTPTWTSYVDGYNANVDFSTLKSNVGSYNTTVPVTFTKDDVSFTANIHYAYSIKPADLIVKANNVSCEYGEGNQNLSYSYSGFVNGENESVLTTQPTVSTTATKTSDVGSYPITVSGGTAANYTLAYESGTLTVMKAPLTAKVNNATKQYGKDNPSFTATYTGLKNGETAPKWSTALKFETSATKASDVGEYDVTATGVPTNYEMSSVTPGKLTITQAPLVIKANDATRKYFEADPEFGYTCTGFVNNDDKKALTKEPTITTAATQTSNAGNYDITASDAQAKNYSITYGKGKLTVTKRPLTITANPASRDYGEENPTLTMTYEGFVNDEDESVLSQRPTISTTATKQSNAGTYPISLTGGKGTNYEITLKEGTLTVNKVPLTVTVENATREYGEANPSFELRYDGLKNGDTKPTWTTAPTITTPATKTSPVGTYTITATGGETSNYVVQYGEAGKLTITVAPLTAKARDLTKKVGEENPELIVDYEGFKNGETKMALTQEPIATTTAQKNSRPGTYPIMLSGGIATNYEFSYVNGTLTVLPAGDEAADKNNVLSMENLIANKNTQVVLPIAMKNEEAITGIQFDLYLPDGVTVATKSNGKMIINTTSRMEGCYTLTSNQMDGYVRIVGYSGDSETFTGNEGDILNVTLNIGDDIANGNYTIRLKDIVLSDINSTDHYPADAAAMLTVKDYTLADVDNSGAININDVVCIINHILNKPNVVFVKGAADVDGNGVININDVVTLINRYILKREVAAARAEMGAVPTSTIRDDNYLHLATIDIQAGETKTISMLMDNASEVRAVQGNIRLPEGVSFVTKSNGRLDVTNLDERSEDFTLSCELQADGSMTFAHYSADGFNYGGNEGGIFTFKIKADEKSNPGTYEVKLSEVVLSINGVGYDIDDRTSNLNVTERQIAGDVNGDFVVDVADIATVISVMASGNAGVSSASADVNGDGIVDVADIATIIDEMAARARMQEEREE